MAAYLRYLGQRLIIFVATIAISVTIVFFTPRLVPGDPLGALSLKLAQVGGNLGGKALVEEYSRRFGLDKSPPEQYVAYLRRKIDRPFGVEQLDTVRGAGYRLLEAGSRPGG